MKIKTWTKKNKDLMREELAEQWITDFYEQNQAIENSLNFDKDKIMSFFNLSNIRLNESIELCNTILDEFILNKEDILNNYIDDIDSWKTVFSNFGTVETMIFPLFYMRNIWNFFKEWN